MHRLVVYVKQYSCLVVKLRNSLLPTLVAQQPGPQSGWLRHLRSDTETSLAYAITGRDISVAEVDECSSST